MSREIKFRCWNGELKKWDECPYPIFEGLNPTKIIGFLDIDGNQQLLEDGSGLVQYTGLKDKNGVEIYEGDVIFVPAWNREYKIVFEAGMFRARNLSHGWSENKVSLATFKGEINCEVIGNIYEHPHLLEVAQ